MQQIALGQTEYYSDKGVYFPISSSTTCSPNPTTSTEIETDLLGGADNITPQMGYDFCVDDGGASSNYEIFADNKSFGGTCEISMTHLNVVTRTNC